MLLIHCTALYCTVLYCRVASGMECRVDTPPVPGLRTLDSRAAPVHLLYGAVTVISVVRDSCFRGVLCFESDIGEKNRNLKRDINKVNVSSDFEENARNTNIDISIRSGANSDHNVDITEMSSDSPHMVVEVLAVQYSQLLVAHRDGCERCPGPNSSSSLSLKPSSPLLHTAPSVTTETWSNSSSAITVWARDESCPRLSVIDGVKPTCRSRGKFIEIIVPLHPAVDKEGPPAAVVKEGQTDTLLTSDNDDDDDDDAITSFPPTPPLETVPPLRHPLIASLMSVEVGHLLLLSGLTPADLLTGDQVSKSFLDFLSAKCDQCCPCCCCGGERGSAIKGDGIGINQDKPKNDHAPLIMTASSLKVPYLEGNASLMSSSAPTRIHPVTFSIANISTLSALSSSPSLQCI